MKKTGAFIVFEGPDGVGKDTMIALTSAYLKERGVEHVVLKDPSPEVAAEIRKALLHKDALSEAARLCLYLAARSELINKQLTPALMEGKTVLCNRFTLSTLAYQGLDFLDEEIKQMCHILCLDRVHPDLQIVYLRKNSHRALNEEDVMGKLCHNFREKIIEKYTNAAKDPEANCVILWTDDLTIEEQFAKTKELIDQIA